MNILFIGDIVGSPGREAVKKGYPILRKEYDIDFFVANAENAAGGSGITKNIVEELFNNGVNAITTGDHIWNNKGSLDIVEDKAVVRPANYPDSNPGKGSTLLKFNNNLSIGLINLVGRTFMPAAECPFLTAKREIEKLKKKTNIILVDFHAEATSEKIAMGWYLDGQVSAVVGTHTHVQTADEKILPQGTAYITDLGMTGPYKSVLGRDIVPVIHKFTTNMPMRFHVAKDDIQVWGVCITIDEQTGKATKIERIKKAIS